MLEPVIIGWVSSALLVGMLYAPVAVGLGFSFRLINYPDLTCEGSFLIGSAASTVLLRWVPLHYSALQPAS